MKPHLKYWDWRKRAAREKLAKERQRTWPLVLLAQRRMISPRDFWRRVELDLW